MLPHFKIVGSLTADYLRRPANRRVAVVLLCASVLGVLAYLLAGHGSASYRMTTCPAASAVGKAARASDLKLLPGSAPGAPGSTTPTDLLCNYVPADQYQRSLHDSHDAPGVEIYLFPEKIVSSRLIGAVDGHAAVQSGKAAVSGQIMLGGKPAPVTSFTSGYGAWTGQRLPDGSYAALAIYLSTGQAPRSTTEFQNELQAMAHVSGLG
jgi:hypothetical protein